jgi:hypothetical protein
MWTNVEETKELRASRAREETRDERVRVEGGAVELQSWKTVDASAREEVMNR